MAAHPLRLSLALGAALALLLGGPLATLAFGPATMRGHWSAATHRPVGIAPSPQTHPAAVVQVYAARTFGWRGAFAVHSWIAAKPARADRYTRYEVIGWFARRGGAGLSVASSRAPDAEWYGQPPRLLRDLRGPAAEAVLARLDEVVAAYPVTTYRAWPGPNSNTFVAWVAREIAELNVALPPHAIGKDYLPDGGPFARTPSGTGWQMSLGGLVGVALARDEGLELNLLGLVAGLSASPPGIKLPGVGQLPAPGP